MSEPHSTAASFSAVITCYNYERFVLDAVDSALAQTIPPREVVVVDDGSTDRSLALLQDRFGTDPRVHIVGKDNGGQLSAFIAGVRASSGDIICFLDADDRWDPGYFAALNDRYRNWPAVDCVLANLRFIGDRGGNWSAEKHDRDWGLTLLWAYFRTGWVGVPTSGISMRATHCRQVLDLPQGCLRDWRVRADDCLVYGSSLLGGRKLYMAEARVDYLVHGSNHWLGARQDEAASLRRNLAIHRLFRHYLGEASRFLFPPMTALLEFKTKPTPTPDELRFYLWMALRAQAPLLMRLRQALSMLRYYRRANRR